MMISQLIKIIQNIFTKHREGAKLICLSIDLTVFKAGFEGK